MFLNTFINNEINKFQVSMSNQEITTPGIWIWNKVIPTQDDKGEIDLLLIDSQGLNSPAMGFDTDVKLLTISTLMASHLFYLQMGHITD
mmetsp:Transcript_41942/g.64223  ORF Transcript_41942/g.64223 Transcript_41942/m.64223 type:complete len:89 (+) Transcript_41942:183-449(+)